MRKQKPQISGAVFDCTADQRLCFSITDSTVPVLRKFEISSFLALFCDCTGRLVSDVVETPEGFLTLLLTAFIEESVVRRELADNFCFYNKHYDSIEGRPRHEKTRLFHITC